ncbi:hypothetical protein ACIQW5_26880 [Methylorubrum thiocyanatum]|uniref:hypothetical protein n=1 Tax=Methylorubrum thiocyanatum TaxID=47958 RepID=UPI00383B7B57
MPAAKHSDHYAGPIKGMSRRASRYRVRALAEGRYDETTPFSRRNEALARGKQMAATWDSAEAVMVLDTWTGEELFRFERAEEPAPKPTSAHGFERGQRVRIRDGYEFSGTARMGEVVTQMHGAQPAWAVRCEFGGRVHYCRPDGIEAVSSPSMAAQPCQQQQAQALPRRAVLSAALASAVAAPLPALALPATPTQGADGEPLPDHAALWARMPLPFTPAEAWHRLTPAAQAEIGAAVIGMALAEYVSGQMHDEPDQFLDEGLREAAYDTHSDLLNRLDERVWVLLPELFGHDDHPAWALNSGMAR